MKARIICNSLSDVREVVCKLSGIERSEDVYLPENKNGNNKYGIACATRGKEVVALTPYWKTDDDKYEVQSDLIGSPQLYRKS